MFSKSLDSRISSAGQIATFDPLNIVGVIAATEPKGKIAPHASRH
jgi:hypothetical protein